MLKTTTSHVVKQMDMMREPRSEMKLLAQVLEDAVKNNRVEKDPDFANYLREYMGFELARVCAKERSIDKVYL